MKNKILVYGALGYTGQLFTKYALKENLPIWAIAENEQGIQKTNGSGLMATKTGNLMKMA